MARPGLAALIPTFSADVVAVFEQNELGADEQIFEDAHLMHASIGEAAHFYTHPLETGRSIVDHRIIQPVTIDLRIILTSRSSLLGAVLRGSTDFEVTARDTYEQMREFFIAGTFIAIQTRTALYRDQVMQAMPHEETSTLFDGVVLTASLSQILTETDTASFSPADAPDSDTVDRGRQNPLGLPSSVSDVTDIFGF